MQHFAHLARAKKYIARAVVRNEETEAIGVPLYPAANQRRLVRDEIGVAPVAHQLAFALHGTHPTLEKRHLFGADIQRFSQFRQLHRMAGLNQNLEHILTAGQGILVAFGLARKERVSAANGAELAFRLAHRRGFSLADLGFCFFCGSIH